MFAKMRSVNSLIVLMLAVTAFSAFASAQTKKNQRAAEPQKAVESTPNTEPAGNGTTYRYEFSQPDFVISRVVISHNDGGRPSFFREAMTNRWRTVG